ncbi:unnamed protein product [Caenorhabditis auriculariae]|uniref:Helicase SKI2W n=1 Tax=Caenorhabditis auriculariae TaxID=2777116 RepID=A0A8S1HNK2_9PELO|nr:unnamed protein product [Caenorhabditis auriculariae]
MTDEASIAITMPNVEYDDEVSKAAECLFRSECVSTLLAPTINLKASSETCNLGIDTIISRGESLEPTTSLVPIINDDGNIVEFVEQSRASEEFGSSSVSMSLNRAPYKDSIMRTSVAHKVRGSSSNVPFSPGFGKGIDDILSGAEVPIDDENASKYNEKELEFLDFSTTLLNQAPGLKPVNLSENASGNQKAPEKEEIPSKPPPVIDLDSTNIFDLLDFVSSGAPNLPASKKSTDEQNKDENATKIEEIPIDSAEEKELEECITESLPHVKEDTRNYDLEASTSTNSTKKFAYANEINTLESYPEYEKLLPRMARKYPFTLDPFQQASVLCMERGESLFVAAHTSAGKTVVAEYAVAMCKVHKTRAIYTSPIKALSNQNFTPKLFCLIMTTEILRSMLYNGSEVIRDLEWVVFDEVHYINNEERGHVWEEVLIMLPSHVKIVMLSATVPNCVEFADWVGRIKNRRINVISTYRRPVPLEHFLYTGQDGKTKKDLFRIIDSTGTWLTKGYNEAVEAKEKLHAKQVHAHQNDRNRGGGGGQGRGGAHPPTRGGANGQFRGGANTGGGKNYPGKNDRNIYSNLINHMRECDQLPMVAFVFSRKRCDDNAQILQTMDLTTQVEKSHVRKFFQQCVEQLKGSDKMLPQVLQMRELCLRGFAVHHSGILPILKEVVELLFQKGYVKILFATETFAMGVNMPARCVVFDSIVKHDGTQKRILNAGEYIQMAGRAGRRGLDPTGTVIVLCKDPAVPQAADLQVLMNGAALRLESKFRVTYSMLLNLLRVEQLRIEDMLQRSYAESGSLREAREKRKNLEKLEQELRSMPPIDCATCEPTLAKTSFSTFGLRVYHDALCSFIYRVSDMWPKVSSEQSVSKLLNVGRFLIVSSAQNCFQNDVVLLLKELSSGSSRSLLIMASCDSLSSSDEALKQADAFSRLNATEKSWNEETCHLEGLAKFGINGARVPSSGRKLFRVCELSYSSLVAIVKKSLKSVQAVEVIAESDRRKLPRFRNEPVSDGVVKLINQLDGVAESLSKGEVEVYSMNELASMCSRVELDTPLVEIASLESTLSDPAVYPARHCTRFDQHMMLQREKVRYERRIETLKYELSSDALLLSDEYQNRLKVLEALGYVENEKMVSLRGRIACEIHHQELLITELILNNRFVTRSSAEVAAMLSALTCQYNSGKEIRFPPETIFAELQDNVTEIMMRLDQTASRFSARAAEVGCELRFDLMEVVYQWANGMPFAEIMQLTDAQEGLIVKCIQRLDEVCKDVRNAARIVGDPALLEKMEEVSASIRRDIVFAASLYTSV